MCCCEEFLVRLIAPCLKDQTVNGLLFHRHSNTSIFLDYAIDYPGKLFEFHRGIPIVPLFFLFEILK